MKRLLCYLVLLKLLTVFAQIQVSGQTLRECPSNWERRATKCYLFEAHPVKTYVEANKKCLSEGATLVSVNDESENAYISGVLLRIDTERNSLWYTSGTDGVLASTIRTYRWDGDGTQITQAAEFWNSEADRKKDGSRIVYGFNDLDGTYGWTKVPLSAPLGYICEIDQKEAYRIYQGKRDFSYGSGAVAQEKIEKGPSFKVVPEDTLVVYNLKSYLDCVAEGNPKPSYQWYKIDNSGTRRKLDPETDTRYTFSDGRLTIPKPNDKLDAGRFQCQAENKFGSILSDPVLLSFGYLHEFSNVPYGDTVVKQYDGTYLSCAPPAFSPSVNFQWVRGDNRYIIPMLNNYYMFISYNGKLYFSETQPNDAGDYSCMVTLNAPYVKSFGLDQPPSRSSLSMKLVVTGETAADFGPSIHSDFIFVTPSPPMAGRDVRMECFAYGKMPLTYRWYRIDGPWTLRHTLTDNNRVLQIKNAKLEDSGQYKCRVTRGGNSAADEKTYSLSIAAIPNFIFPLKNEHADIGQQLTWHCEAEALPPATYRWLKNSVPLQNIPNVIEIRQNSLRFSKLDQDRDPGMYQCEATSSISKNSVYSGAQLRVLQVAPSLDKYHTPDSVLAANGGDITIPCRAEGAPQPTIAWLKNGGNLNLSPQDRPTDVDTITSHSVMLLTDGSLYITSVMEGDVGQYECVATNDLGEARARTQLHVVRGPQITFPPSNKEVIVKNPTFMPCSVSYDSKLLDLVYLWKLNGYALDVPNDPHYEISQGIRNSGSAGLHIKDANFYHEGKYECVVETPAGTTSASAYLTVLGPPAAPGGAYGNTATITQSSIQLTWTNGADHGSPIESYIIEYNTDYTPEYKVLISKIKEVDAKQEVDARWPNRRTFTVENLLPYVGYRFQIRSKNRYGISDPSLPTTRYTTLGARPRKAPENVHGVDDFQAVGLLTMRWKSLKPDEWGAEKLVYNVHWRKSSDAPDGLWSSHSLDGVKGAEIQEYVALVGTENFYLEYEVKVGSINVHGPGQNSTIAHVMSAEAMPTTACTNVNGQGYNSTAFETYWTPPPNTREAVGGRIKGFQVNWWIADGVTSAPSIWEIMKVNDDDTNSAIVIGVEPNTNYWFDVQCFNTAGLGPRSEKYLIETAFLAPGTFPKYVTVWSYSEDSVLVTWQGISTNVWEDTLKGYKVKYFKAQDDIRSAKVIITDKVYRVVLPKIEKSTAYAVRIQGWNGGGDGALSPSVYFTLVAGSGAVYMADPHTTDIIPGRSGSSHLSSLSTLSVFLIANIIFIVSK